MKFQILLSSLFLLVACSTKPVATVTENSLSVEREVASSNEKNCIIHASPETPGIQALSTHLAQYGYKVVLNPALISAYSKTTFVQSLRTYIRKKQSSDKFNPKKDLFLYVVDGTFPWSSKSNSWFGGGYSAKSDTATFKILRPIDYTLIDEPEVFDVYYVDDKPTALGKVRATIYIRAQNHSAEYPDLKDPVSVKLEIKDTELAPCRN